MPLVVTAILYPVLMRGGAEEYRQYDESTAALSEATVEFVHGIAVVKRFGQVGRSHRRYRDQTKQYSRFVAEWTRETATMFTVIEIITSPVVVLVWLLAAGLWLVGAGVAAPIDVLPGLLTDFGLTGPLLKLGLLGPVSARCHQGAGLAVRVLCPVSRAAAGRAIHPAGPRRRLRQSLLSAMTVSTGCCTGSRRPARRAP